MGWQVKGIFDRFVQIFIKWLYWLIMDKKKEEKEAYATDDPTDASAEKQEEMAKEAIKKFKSLN